MAFHPYTRLFPKLVDPTVTDDDTSTPPHEVGDFWINLLTGAIFQATDVSTGAAVWNTGGGGGVGFNDAEGDPANVAFSLALDGTSTYAARRDHAHKYELASHINSAGSDTPASGDEFGFRQLASGLLKKITWTNLLAAARTYLDTVYGAIANAVTNGNSHDHVGGDGAQIDHTTASNIGTNSHATIDTILGALAATYAAIANGVTNGNSHNHVGGDGAVLYHTDTVGAFLNGVSVPASTTYHGCPFKIGADATTNSFPWSEPGDLTDMTLRIGSAQPGTGSLVCTLYVNNVASALVITIAAGSAGPANYSDTTHTVTIATSDILRWVIQNNATSGSATLTAVSMKLKKPTT
jgi:hypothetical protein